MKRIFILIGIFLVTALAAPAQQGKGGEQLEALKIAYLTRKLNLTSDEAQRFWPVYNQYNAELKSVRRESRGGDELDREEKLLSVRKKYQSEFSKALSPEKANDFFRAEKEFYGYVQKELMERRQQRNGGRKNNQ
jgi:hypothetical protein